MQLKRHSLRLIVLAFIVAGFTAFYSIEVAPRANLHHVSDLIDLIRSYGWIAWLFAAGLIILQALIPYAPFALLAGVNVILFGFLSGFLISWTAAVIGSCVMFFTIRWGAKQAVEQKFSHYSFYRRFAHLLESNGFLVIFFARLVPFLPLTFVNAVSAVSPVSFSTFFTASLLGKIPIIAAESAFGAGLLNSRENAELLFIGGGILLILAAAGWFLKKRFQQQAIH